MAQDLARIKNRIIRKREGFYMNKKLDYIEFRIKKLIWDELRKAKIVKKRPLFDRGVQIYFLWE